MGNRNSVPSNKPIKERRRDNHSTDGSRASKSKRTVNNSGTPGSPGSTTGTPKTLGKLPMTTNPFIIFFLRLRSKKPNERVTVIARAAGKLWSKMSSDERKKYIDLANAEKKRREERKRKRKINRS